MGDTARMPHSACRTAVIAVLLCIALLATASQLYELPQLYGRVDSGARRLAKTVTFNTPAQRRILSSVENWFSVAEQKGCSLIDGYASITRDLAQFGYNEDLSPFKPENWNLSLLQRPTISRTLHNRALQILSRSALFKVNNHTGRITRANDNDTASSQIGWLKSIVKMLPDMEFVFNCWDEAVLLPHHPSIFQELQAFAPNGVTEDPANPYALALLDSSQCANASENFQKFRHLEGSFQLPRPKIHERLPIFSWATIGSCYEDIVLPAKHTFEKDPVKEERLVPWDEKREVLFWRGSANGVNVFDPSLYDLAQRPRFVAYSRYFEKLLEHNANADVVPIDARFTHYRMDAKYHERMKEKYGDLDFVPLEEQWKYKYLMVLDGWSFSDRLQTFLSSGSLVFRATLYEEWFEERIVPYKHYVPVKLDFSDLQEKLLYYREHDEAALEIATAARELALRELRRQDHFCYSTRLLIEYSTLLKEENNDNMQA